MIRRAAFPPPPADPMGPILHREGTTYQIVDEARVRKTSFDQSERKAPGPERLIFSALRLLWEWVASSAMTLICQCIRLRHHPRAWKRAKRVVL